MRRGVWYAVGAYTLFGFFPLYWKPLEQVPALQTVSHRIVWSCLVVLAIVGLSSGWSAFVIEARSRRALTLYTAAAAAIAVNWFVYIWAVNAGFVVQTALGYFINPLVSVSLGVLMLGERLRPAQWLAIGLATLGVAYLTMLNGALPWIALTLALSFGTYGLLKKTAPLDALHGLALETSILAPAAFVFLASQEYVGRGLFGHAGTSMTLLMIGAGPVTTLPLLLFAAAVRRIPLSLMGMLQYINPTIQLLLGVFLYKEPFSRSQFAGFACVWAALVVYAIEGIASAGRVEDLKREEELRRVEASRRV